MLESVTAPKAPVSSLYIQRFCPSVKHEKVIAAELGVDPLVPATR